MIRNSEKANDFVIGFGRVLNKVASDDWTLEKVAEKEVDDFLQFQELAKSWKQFSELAVGICEQMDEQSKMLEDLQRDMARLKIVNKD